MAQAKLLVQNFVCELLGFEIFNELPHLGERGVVPRLALLPGTIASLDSYEFCLHNSLILRIPTAIIL